jgi:DNA-binding protein H-NS
MQLTPDLTLDQVLAIEMQIEAKKLELAKNQRPIDLIKCKKIIALHSFSPEELGIVMKNSGQKAKRGKLPIKYFDPKTYAHWTGNGSPKIAFMQAHLNKIMDHYLINNEDAASVAQVIKRDVKTISGDVVKYVPLPLMQNPIL